MRNATHLQIFFQLYYYWSRVTYKNYKTKLWMTISRNSRPEVICKKAALKTTQNLQENFTQNLPVSESFF